MVGRLVYGRGVWSWAACVVVLALPPYGAFAQSPAPAAAPAATPTTSAPPAALVAGAPVSTSVVVNLIRLLVQQGVLTEDKADALIRQAQDEAQKAAAQQQATGAAAAAGAATGTTVGGPQPPPSVHVMYVPEIVKRQLRDEIKQEVLSDEKNEGFAQSGGLPEWLSRFHPMGDFRLRYEWDFFDSRNSPLFVNFASLNEGSPIDISSAANLPFVNTTSDRQRLRLRARAGFTVDIADDVRGGLRLATGNQTDPVSTNQTLGTDFNKDPILLDLGYLQFTPRPWLALWAGRMPSPWFGTDLVWSEDLNFDGLALQASTPLNQQMTPFLNAGIFPVENTDFNFPDNSPFKTGSHNKWLNAIQAGLDWRPTSAWDLKFGVAYYDYENIQGEFSSSCDATASNIPCSSDDTRPQFQQQGNTLFAIRNTGSAAPNFQYFGLSSAFRELDITTRFDYAKYDPIHIELDGDFVTNLALNPAQVEATAPVNNQGSCMAPGGAACVGPWAGGGNGFMARLQVGHPLIVERGDWNIFTEYKYLESDAVLDAFTDSNFHLGGTNAKGYIFGGSYGLAHNVWLTGRWYSAQEISSLPYSVDVLQFDLNARY